MDFISSLVGRNFRVDLFSRGAANSGLCARAEGRKMPKITQINGKVMIKREQRLLADSAERSNFTESKVNPIINHVKIKTVSHTWLRSFCLS